MFLKGVKMPESVEALAEKSDKAPVFGISKVTERLVPIKALKKTDEILREGNVSTELDFGRDYEAEDQIKEGK